MNSPVSVIILFVVAIAFIVISSIASKRVQKRNEAFGALAAERRWSFHPAPLPPDVDFEPFDVFSRGDEQAYYNTLRGPVEAGRHTYFFKAGDFDYTVQSGKNEETRTFSYMLVPLRGDTPSLFIRAEGWEDKLAHVAGFEDIRFESEEFNRKVCVKCVDKKFAYEVVTPQMMEFLLKGVSLPIRIENGVLCVTDGTMTWQPGQFEGMAAWAGQFLALWPEFLIKEEASA